MSPSPPIDEDGPSWQCIFATLRRPGATADEVTITTSDGCSVPYDTLLPAASVPADGAPADFTIIGIGVSAGGLAAFEEFFSDMPVDAEPRLLDPAAPRGRHLPIDRFFASLAQDQRERAIAVVLTGTGSDGTAGVRAVKAEGGMVMAVQTQHHPAPRAGPVHATRAAAGPPTLREMTERALLQQVAPASALVDAHGDICYLHGRTGLYVEPAPGDAGVNNILKMAREGLRRQLSLGLHSAVTTRQPVRVADLRVQSEGQVSGVCLSVIPVQTAAWADAAAPLYLVCLAAAPLTESSIDAAARSSDHNGGDSQATIDALRK